MPPYVRGGVWTNVEDEILRAAVSKYGMQQWSRVASLLVRKTAKQCKARWAEWLSPNVRRSDWAASEDEKLMHLAKIMPNMWRSIADMLGRTATQCLERYNYLLMAGSAMEEVQDANGDAAIESRPARPDFEDMDDDEEEMLMEARARLANTKGKKAKRKERERFLAQQQRLKVLDQRQIDKAEGRVPQKLTLKKSKYSVDYNEEIPFEHSAPQGAHDTAFEQLENAKARDQFVGKLSSQEPVQFGKSKSHVSSRERQNLPPPSVVPLDLPSPEEVHESVKRRPPKLVGQFNLPPPQNNFELAPPPQVAIPEPVVVKSEDVEMKLAGDLRELESRQATAAQRSLPMPVNIHGRDLISRECLYIVDHASEAVLPASEDMQRVTRLVDAEMANSTARNPDSVILNRAKPQLVDAESAIAAEFDQFMGLSSRLSHAIESLRNERIRLAAFQDLARDEETGIAERITDLRKAVSNAESHIY